MNVESQDLAPWDKAMAYINSQPDPAGFFAAIQRMGDDLCGFIICKWKRDDGPPEFFLSGRFTWQSFSDDGQAQYPTIYKTLKGVQGALERVPSIFPRNGRHFGLWLWKHPEYSDQPLEKYAELKSLFPGCPTQ